MGEMIQEKLRNLMDSSIEILSYAFNVLFVLKETNLLKLILSL